MRRFLIVLALAAAGFFAYAATQRGTTSAPIPDVADKGPRTDRGARAFGAAVTIEPLRSDATYRERFASTFDSLTPENEMKWEQLQPSVARFTFADADRIVEWAERHGKRVRGHPLVWDQQMPAWLATGRWSAAQLEDIVRKHVTRVVERYQGRVESWDVVNEPFEDDGSWSQTLFYNVLRERFVEIAFRAARAADPDARLFLNELAAERKGPKQDALFDLVQDLKARGVPIDGVGFQNHTEAGEAPSQRELMRTLERFAALGLDVEITEMDVEAPAPGDDAQQAEAYAAAARACTAIRRCTGLTVWGVTDRYHWLGADRRAALFAADGRPKPARAALRAALE